MSTTNTQSKPKRTVKEKLYTLEFSSLNPGHFHVLQGGWGLGKEERGSFYMFISGLNIFSTMLVLAKNKKEAAEKGWRRLLEPKPELWSIRATATFPEGCLPGKLYTTSQKLAEFYIERQIRIDELIPRKEPLDYSKLQVFQVSVNLEN
jgi:hypothetical protein